VIVSLSNPEDSLGSLRDSLISKALDLERRGEPEGTMDFAFYVKRGEKEAPEREFFVNITINRSVYDPLESGARFVFNMYKRKFGDRTFSYTFIVKVPHLKPTPNINKNSINIQTRSPYDDLETYPQEEKELKAEIIGFWND
jgi:hypothetical protein